MKRPYQGVSTEDIQKRIESVRKSLPYAEGQDYYTEKQDLCDMEVELVVRQAVPLESLTRGPHV